MACEWAGGREDECGRGRACARARDGYGYHGRSMKKEWGPRLAGQRGRNKGRRVDESCGGGAYGASI